MWSIDLTPQSRREARRRRRRARAWCATVAVFGVAATAGGAGTAAALSPDPESADAWAASTERLEAAAARSEGLRAQVARLETSLRAEQAARTRPEWSLLLRFIASEAQGLAVLDGFSIKLHPQAIGSEAYAVTLSGRASGAASPTTLALRLERSGVFTSVAVDSGGAFGGGDARFVIEATLGTPAPQPEGEEGVP